MNKSRLIRLLALPVMALPFILVLTTTVLGDGDPVLGGSPFRGREIFFEKGCGRCHSVWAQGETLGPNIAVAVAGKSFYDLVGDFWNHTPRMIDELGDRGYEWPSLDPRQMADILNYLYYLQLFDRPGDAVRGADTFARLHCFDCHTLGGQGGSGGGALDNFGAYPSPAPLARDMWNAGPVMQQEQLRAGRAIPQFTGSEMADLQAFIRAEGVRERRESILQPLPDPERGAIIYRSKRCGACHDRSRGNIPDITQSALSKTVSEITGLLWNHSYAMHSEMASQGIPFPRFKDSELSDLIAHLYFLGYIGADGDAETGEKVFEAKGCVVCHTGGVEGVPDLGATLDRTDRAGLAAAMWNHAPQMHSLMAEKAPFWPKFEQDEMRHLAAYLRAIAGGDRE